MDDRLDAAGVGLQLFEHLFRPPEVGDRMFGEILPLAEVGAFEAITDHDVMLPCLTKAGDNVGSDEAGAAGDHDHAACHWPSPFASFWMVAVVEWPGENSASRTSPPQDSTSAAPTTVSRV